MTARQKTINGASPLPRGALETKTRATAEAGGKKGPFHKPLPKEFRRDGFQYRQIAREGDAAIYEQTWNGCAESKRLLRSDSCSPTRGISDRRQIC